jgi:hypothetical protein
MRPDDVQRPDAPAESSRSPGAAKSAPPGESFSAVLGPPVAAQPQGQGEAPAPMVPPPALAGLVASPPSLLAGARMTAGQGPISRALRPDPLDPATRHSAQIAPLLAMSDGPASPAPLDAPVQVTARASLEEVLPALVRRIAWSGDGKRGTLRLEFGQGALAGGTLLVHADDGRVRVELQAPPGADTSVWKTRIASRLTKRGVKLDELIVE